MLLNIHISSYNGIDAAQDAPAIPEIRKLLTHPTVVGFVLYCSFKMEKNNKNLI